MYMSKIQLRQDAAKTKSFWQALQDGYQSHCHLWNLFADSNDRRRDFLYRQEQRHGMPLFFTVSERPPKDADGLWHVQSKPYTPQLTVGQRLGFVLCANPVRSKRDSDQKQHRHDVVMEAKTRLKAEGKSQSARPSDVELIQEAGFAWLASRGDQHGFSVTDGEVRCEGYRQHRWYKSKGHHQVRLSTIDFTGLLTVSDPGRFKEALYRGIGPAKGFGCGLMLVRRV